MKQIIPQLFKSCFCKRRQYFWQRRKRKNYLLLGTFLQQANFVAREKAFGGECESLFAPSRCVVQACGACYRGRQGFTLAW
jgi:hypothetical protein